MESFTKSDEEPLLAEPPQLGQGYLNPKTMYAAFFELLHQLYWKRYAENLQEQNPKSFNLQYNQFLNQFPII